METNELKHYGTPHSGSKSHSGRYPFGSGEDPYQRNKDLLGRIRKYQKEYGMSEAQVAKALGMSTTELRAKKSIAFNQEKKEQIARAVRLKEHGYTNQKIAELMGLPNESSVRDLLKRSEREETDKIQPTVDMLKKNVDAKKAIDIGAGVELECNVSKEKLATAAAVLQEKGYEVNTISVPQASMPGQWTNIKVLSVPGLTAKDLYKDPTLIKSIEDYSSDNGETFRTFEYPASLDSKRIFIRYGDEGGSAKDGMIELRRGVDDISLGGANYAQVRIMIDDKYYAKGMAVYSDSIPDGYDMVVNSNKASGSPLSKVLKPLKTVKDPVTGNDVIDVDNPFGAAVKAGGQVYYLDADGKQKLGVVNKLKEEGEWNDYSKTLSSQFLSKQPVTLIKSQLNLSIAEKQDEFDTIMSVTNPVVKQKLLDAFASSCDSAAVDLKAAALPGQSTKVLLPITSLKDNEIYAPSLKDGSEVVLIRYPHAGTFEIPKLKVNNKNADGDDIIGKKSIDAVGISLKAAQQLSGADFDGDTAMVIPVNDKVRIQHSKPLKELEGFTDKMEKLYGLPDDKDANGNYIVPGIKSQTKQNEMGRVSNLITDMTLQGAPTDEIARAVKHSMVVIDSEKHRLDYKKSYEDNGIEELKRKWQGENDKGQVKGASTIISKASSEARINEIEIMNSETGGKGWKPNAKTGEWEYRETGRTIKKLVKDKNGNPKLDKDGNRIYKEEKATTKTSKMMAVKDAFELVRDPNDPKEAAYANYANQMKAMGNKARKESLSIKNIEVSKSAKEKYSAEIHKLDADLERALKNAPRERQAQIAAYDMLKQKRTQYPDMSKDDLKKWRQQSIAKGRAKYGAGKKDVSIVITDKEWEAIQNNAVSTNKLKKIVNNTDLDTLKKMATPRQTSTLSNQKINRIKALSNSGFTISEISQMCDISVSSVSKYIN